MDGGDQAGRHGLIEQLPQFRCVVGEAEIGDQDVGQLDVGEAQAAFLHAPRRLHGAQQRRITPILRCLHGRHDPPIQVRSGTNLRHLHRRLSFLSAVRPPCLCFASERESVAVNTSGGDNLLRSVPSDRRHCCPSRSFYSAFGPQIILL